MRLATRFLLSLSLYVATTVTCLAQENAFPLLGTWAVHPPGEAVSSILRFDEDGSVENLTADGFGDYFVLRDGRVLVEFPDGVFLVDVRKRGEDRILQGAFAAKQPMNVRLSPATEADTEAAAATHAELMSRVNQVRTQQLEMAIRNNLRQFASAAQQYMLDEGAESVGYEQIVGEGKLIQELVPINGEDYTELKITYDDFSLSVTDAEGNTVRYDF